MKKRYNWYMSRLLFRFFSFFVLICLFVWLLPLGAFIKPSQEKIACDGHRAFHMCCMMLGKVNPNPSSKISFTTASDFGHGAKSSAAGGDDFLPIKNKQYPSIASQRHYETSWLATYFHFQNPLDPPPKSSPLF